MDEQPRILQFPQRSYYDVKRESHETEIRVRFPSDREMTAVLWTVTDGRQIFDMETWRGF